MPTKDQTNTVADSRLARQSEQAKSPMKRSQFFALAIVLLFPFLVVEIGTLDLGHEMTYFGRLSQLQSAYVRYALLFIPVCLFAVAAFRNSKRNSSTAF
jgi:hypothetical protein